MMGVEHGAIESVAPEEMLVPASLVQNRFWGVIQANPSISSLNVSVRWRLDGIIRAEIIERACQKLIARHESLRTRFIEQAGALQQDVAETATFKLSVIDLTRLSDEQREREVLAIGSREALRAFDLSSPPLMRMALLRLSEASAIIILTVHHLVADGWSMGILAREFAIIAAAIDRGEDPVLPEIAMQYADFALWQREVLSSHAFDRDLAYWRAKLENMPAFRVPPHHERPTEPIAKGEIKSILLDTTLTNQLEQSARDEGYSFFTIVAAALAATLHRFTGSDEVVFGTQVAGRQHADLQSIVGPFVNTLVLRIDASGNPNFDDFSKRFIAVSRDALTHERLPCELLLESLPWPDHKGRAYVCPINFSFERAFIETKRYGALELVSIPSQSTGALFDLSFFAVRRPEGWRISCEANTDIYDDGIAGELVELWRSALETMSATPDVTINRFGNVRQIEAPQDEAKTQSPSDDVAEAVPDAGASLAEMDGSDCSDEFPVTPLQQKFWDLDRRLAGDPTLNVAARWQIAGPIDIELLNRSLQLILDRHEALRTSFTEKDGTLLQIVQSRTGAKVRSVDLTELAGEAQQAEVERLGSEEARAPFDLASAPLLRLTLIRLSATKAELLLTTHHIVSDCWSGGIFARDLCEIYSALSEGREPHLAELSLQYGDYADWQNAWIKEGGGSASERYWLGRLSGISPIHMPADRPVPQQPTKRGVLVSRSIPPTLIDAAHAATRAQGATFFMIGVAALATTLRAWSGSDNVIFSTQVSGRDKPGLEGPIGPFSNWLALCHQLNGEMRLVDVVAQVRETVGAALEHSLLPIDCIEKKLGDWAGREASRRSPLRAVNFLVLGNLSRDADAGAFVLKGVPGFSAGAKYDLNIFMTQTPGAWQIWCEYDPDIFEGATVEKVLAAYVHALHAVSTEPERHLASLSLGIERAASDFGAPGSSAEEPKSTRPAELPSASQHNSLNPDQDQSLPAIEVDMRRVADIWASVLNRPEIKLDQGFFEQGGDSLTAAKLLSRIKDELGLRATLTTLFRASTLRDFVRALGGTVEDVATADPRIIEIESRGHGTPIIGINNSMILHALSEKLGHDRRMIAIKYFEGEQERRLPSRALEDIAVDYIRLIRQVQPNGPYVLFGLCVHGVLAFEIGRQLQAAGERVPLIVVEDCWEPEFIRSLGHLQSWRVRFHDVGLHLKSWRKGEMTFPQLLALYSVVRKSRVLDLAVRLGLIDKVPPRTGNEENNWWLLHLMDARNRYWTEPYDTDVMMFVSDDVPNGLGFDRTLGWSKVVNGRLDIIPVSGVHGGLSHGEGLESFSRHLRRALDHFDTRLGGKSSRRLETLH